MPAREKKKGWFPYMSNFFKVKEHGSTVRTEIMAGVTTFMAMAYILMVNAGMFSSLGTVSYGESTSQLPFPPLSAPFSSVFCPTCRWRRLPAWV